MSQLLVDDIVNKDDTGAAGLSKGIVVTGITTSDSAIVGYGVTINSTGIQIEAGIVTAFCAKVGSGVTINATGIDAVSGIVTASAAGGGLKTAIDAKASTGKAIAMAMVFG